VNMTENPYKRQNLILILILLVNTFVTKYVQF